MLFIGQCSLRLTRKTSLTINRTQVVHKTLFSYRSDSSINPSNFFCNGASADSFHANVDLASTSAEFSGWRVWPYATTYATYANYCRKWCINPALPAIGADSVHTSDEPPQSSPVMRPETSPVRLNVVQLFNIAPTVSDCIQTKTQTNRTSVLNARGFLVHPHSRAPPSLNAYIRIRMRADGESGIITRA